MPSAVRIQLLYGPLTFSPAPEHVMDALQSVQISENAVDRNGFQLQFALGKNAALDRMLAERSLDPPNRILVVVTVSGRTEVLADGVVTRHDVAKSNSAGASTLTITGVDVGQMMDLIDISGLPLPMPAEARVALLLAPFAAYGVVPMIVPSVLVFAPNPIERVPSAQGTTYAYLKRLADEVGYVFTVGTGPAPGTNLAYWGPEIRAGVPQAALTVNSDAESNVEQLSFSFNGIERTVYVLTIFPKEVKVPIPIPLPDITPLSPPLGSKIPIPLSFKRMNVEPRAADKSDDSTARMDVVQALARGLGRASQSANVITASGALDVVRYGRLLRAGKQVTVRGAGRAYDGEYSVKSVSTTLKPGEAKQRFTLTRNAQVSLSSTVAP